MKRSGFALIEIIIVVALIAASVSFVAVGYKGYGKKQNLSSSYADLQNALNEAKSLSLSSVKPAGYCDSTKTLVGYRINLLTSPAPGKYVLDVLCSDSLGVEKAFQIKSLAFPVGVALATAGALNSFCTAPGKTPYSCVLFEVLSGESSTSGTLTFSQGSTTKIINIDSNGTISSN